MRQAARIARAGELAARTYFERAGYEILDVNWRCPYGELDLVARQAGRLVVIEVKARTGDEFGRPEEAVTPVKLERVERAAQAYLEAHPGLEGDWRVDVVAVRCAKDGSVQAFEHYEDVLQR